VIRSDISRACKSILKLCIVRPRRQLLDENFAIPKLETLFPEQISKRNFSTRPVAPVRGRDHHRRDWWIDDYRRPFLKDVLSRSVHASSAAGTRALTLRLNEGLTRQTSGRSRMT